MGAALVTDRLELFLEPRRRRTHVLRLVREILDRPAQGGTDLERGLDAVLPTLKRRSVLFVISDFLDSPCTARPQGGRRPPRRDRGGDRRSARPGDPAGRSGGAARRRDGRDGPGQRPAPRPAGTPSSGRREREDLARLTRKLGVDRLELRTDRPYINTLLAFFEQRRKRLRR